MARSDGKVQIDVEFNQKKVSKDISNIKKDVGTLKNLEVLKTVGSAIMGIGKSVAGFAMSIGKVGMEFEAAMSQVAATMAIDQTSEDFKKLSAVAKDMGMKTKFSASESAEALNYLALAGYSVEDAIKTLPKILNLASAGGMELARASDMVTDALSALNLGTDYAETLVDKMAKTAQNSNTSVSQLGDALLTVGGTAGVLQGGVDELNTALGVLADNSYKGSEGGTLLRNIILALTAGTDKAKAKIKELGINIADANGKMRPLDDIFGQFDEKLSSMTEIEKTEVLNEIFNKVDLKAVNSMLTASSGAFAELQNKIMNSEGSAKQMAETMENNLKGAVTASKSAMEGLGIALFEMDFGEGASGFIKTFTQGIQEMGKHLSKTELLDTGEVIEKAIDPKAAFDAGLNMINNLLQGIISGIPNLANGLKSLVSNLVPSLKANIPILVSSFVEMVKNLISIIPTMIPDIIAGAVLIAHGLLKGLEQIIPLIPGFIWDVISSIVQGLIQNFPLIVDTIMTFIRVKLLLAIGGGIKALYGGIIIAFNALFTSLKEWTGKTFPQLGKAILQGILNGITGIGNWIAEKGKQVKDELVGGFKKLFGIKSPSRVMADEIGQYIPQGIALGVEADIPKSFRNIEYDINRGIGGMAINGIAGGSANAGNKFNVVINNPNFTDQNGINNVMQQFSNNLQRIGVI